MLSYKENRNSLKKYLYKEDLDWAKNEKNKNKKVAIWGTGSEAMTFLDITYIEYDFFIETSPTQKKLKNKPIYCSNILTKLSPQKLSIIVCSEYRDEIEPQLLKNNFFDKLNYIFPNSPKSKKLVFYTKDKFDHQKVVQLMNDNYEYVRLTKGNNLEANKDNIWEVLIKNKDLKMLLDNELLSKKISKYGFNFKWTEPIGFQEEFLYFPSLISEKIFKNKIINKMGNWAMDEKSIMLYTLYNYLFQSPKGYRDQIFNRNSLDKNIIKKYKFEKDIEIYNFLFENEWIPPISDIRRWAALNKSLFLQNKFKYKIGFDCLFIITIRKKGNKEIVIKKVIQFLVNQNFNFLKSIPLNKYERKIIRENTRGNCWRENKASIKGGGPEHLLIFLDKNESNNNFIAEDIFKNNQWKKIKESIRLEFKDSEMDSSKVNWIHSTDDHIESLETINLLSNNKKEEILKLLT